MYTKLHTKSYSNNGRLFFLLNPNEDIAENDPVRVVDAVVETHDSLIGDLKDALAAESQSADKERKKQQREKKRQIKELEKHRDKLGEYDSRSARPRSNPHHRLHL